MPFISKLWNRMVGWSGYRAIRVRLTKSSSTTADILPVPGYRQIDTYSCGFVAGLMVLHFFYPRKSAEKFLEKVDPDETWGVSKARLAQSLRESGVRVSERRNLTFHKIAKAIEDWKPILVVLQKKEFGKCHWALIYGVDKQAGAIYVAGNGVPGGHIWKTHEMSWALFKDQWESGYGLVCSK